MQTAVTVRKAAKAVAAGIVGSDVEGTSLYEVVCPNGSYGPKVATPSAPFPAPGKISVTMTVPAAVPSLFHNSRP
jgi:hypothetical protein